MFHIVTAKLVRFERGKTEASMRMTWRILMMHWRRFSITVTEHCWSRSWMIKAARSSCWWSTGVGMVQGVLECCWTMSRVLPVQSRISLLLWNNSVSGLTTCSTCRKSNRIWTHLPARVLEVPGCSCVINLVHLRQLMIRSPAVVIVVFRIVSPSLLLSPGQHISSSFIH